MSPGPSDRPSGEAPAKIHSRDRNLLITILLISVIALGTSWLAVRGSTNQLLKKSATEAAERWASVFRDGLGSLDSILAGGGLSASDHRLIDVAMRGGRVIGYRFYSAQGAVVLTSEARAAGAAPSQLPAAVRHGRTVVELNRDREIGGRRMVMSEAHIPVMKGGRFAGAIAVNVDMTGRAAEVRRAATNVMLGVAALLLLVGGVCGFFVARNIAARNREMMVLMESQRRAAEAEQKAAQASQSKSEFLATVSHELRTPLNAIIGFSEVIAGESFGPLSNPQYAEFARDIHNSGTHLLEVINDILDLSKIEAGKLDLFEDDFDPILVIQSSIRLVRPRAESKDVTLSVSIPGPLPKLRADERKVRQILINLLSNAVKFTPDGGAVTVAAETEGDRGLKIAVIDTGIGIAPEDIPIVLAPFGQADSSRSRNFEGTGLGLPLAKSLAELHGGSLEIESEVGSGTTATIYFPSRRLAA